MLLHATNWLTKIMARPNWKLSGTMDTHKTLLLAPHMNWRYLELCNTFRWLNIHCCRKNKNPDYWVQSRRVLASSPRGYSMHHEANGNSSWRFTLLVVTCLFYDLQKSGKQGKTDSSAQCRLKVYSFYDRLVSKRAPQAAPLAVAALSVY